MGQYKYYLDVKGKKIVQIPSIVDYVYGKWVAVVGYIYKIQSIKNLKQDHTFYFKVQTKFAESICFG